MIYDAVREGNRLLDTGDTDGARDRSAEVLVMLDLLGLSPYDAAWQRTGSDDDRLQNAVDVLVGSLLDQRTEARGAKDFATADAIRDRIKAAGIEIEDTPDGPKWSLAGSDD